MKGSKKWITLVLSFFLVVMVALTACSKEKSAETASPVPSADKATQKPEPTKQPEPTKAEPFEIKWLRPIDISKPYDPNKDAVKDAVEQALGVKFKVELVDTQQYKTKLNLKMSSGDVPDIVRMDVADDFQKYAPQGAFVDLTTMINEKDTPNIWREIPQNIFDLLKVNGKIYGIPYVGGPGSGYRWNIVMRSDYLKAINVEVPKTLDEYYNDLKKIKETYPDVIPLGGYTSQIGEVKYANNSFDLVFGAFGVTPGYFTEKDGKFSSYDIDPRMKDALLFLQKMYKENLIDKEFATIKEEQLRDKLYSGKLFSWMGWWSTASDYDTQIETFLQKKDGKLGKDAALPDQSQQPYIYLALTDALLGKDGIYVAPQGAPFGQVNAISAKTKDPKQLLQIIDKGLTEENQMLSVWGVENTDYKIADGKLAQITDAVSPDTLVDKDGKYRGIQSYTWAPGLKGWPRYLEAVPLRKSQSLGIAINNKYQIQDASNYLDSPTKIAKMKEINTIRDSYFTQIIMGADISKFDEFVAKWKSQGGDKILQELEDSFKKKTGN
ncbi:extracellular solute-binding protein [Gorillibacterium massiliense]|uniref:extracellular solute-binding protein n=1 Tax=Gorillibacterium massiliense TaxID=1280390 RepID=UPI0004B87981|nr:extracellular solute-binding protein [Gorillibacterium massiliense]